ncbi:glycerophosphoryl diester phosphodiesterase membrane domain-containing protein [Streptomyces cinereospinus]
MVRPLRPAEPRPGSPAPAARPRLGRRPAPGGHGGGHGTWQAPGGYGGWGSQWGGPPPAAKPGVIPLRPLGVGEILDGAVSTMRAHWRTVLGIALTVAVVIEVVVILLQGFVLDERTGTAALEDPDATLDELTRAMGDALLSSAVLFLITLIGTVAATALLTTVTSRAVLGKPVTTGEAWRDARPRVLKLFGLIFLLLFIALGVALLGAVPGILVTLAGGGAAGAGLTVLGSLCTGVVALWLMVRFSLASPALMLEKQGILKAMSRSAKLVRGAWWRVFGIQLLATVIANIVAAIVVIPFTFLAAALSGDGVSGFLDGTGDFGWMFLIVSGIGSVIGSMITFPITAGVTVLLYIDQRIRREALDLELARAAGVRGYGPGTADPAPGS